MDPITKEQAARADFADPTAREFQYYERLRLSEVMRESLASPIVEALEATDEAVTLSSRPMGPVQVEIDGTALVECLAAPLGGTPAVLVGADYPLDLTGTPGEAIYASASLGLIVDGEALQTATLEGERANTEGGAGPFDLSGEGAATVDVTVNGGDPVTVEIAALPGYAETETEGPWDVTPGGTVELAIDGGVMPITATFNATPAVRTSTAMGPFDLEPGQSIVLEENGTPREALFAATAAVKTSPNTGPHTFESGMTLNVSVDGGEAQTVSFGGTAGYATSAAGPTWNLSGGGTLIFTRDGAEPGGPGDVTVTFANEDFVDASAATATEIAAKIGAHPSFGGSSWFVQTVDGDTKVRVFSGTEGSSSAVAVGGTFAATLSFTPTAGTGFAADIAAATSDEVAARLDDVLTGASAAASMGGVMAITSATRGTGSSIEVSAGATATMLGFSATPAVGTGNVSDIDAVTAAEVADVLNVVLEDATAEATETEAVRITTDRAGTGQTIEVTGGTANATLQFSTELVAGEGFAVDASAANAAEVAAVLADAVGVSGQVSITNGKPRVQGLIFGTDGAVEVTGGTAAGTFAFQETLGSGDVADLSAVTPEEVEAIFDDALDGVAFVAQGETGPVLTTYRFGTGASLELVGAAFLAEVGWVDSAGVGNVADLSAVTADEAKAVIEDEISGVVVDADADHLSIATVSTGPDATVAVGEASDAAFGLDGEAQGEESGGEISVPSGRFYIAPDESAQVRLPVGTVDGTLVTVKYAAMPA